MKIIYPDGMSEEPSYDHMFIVLIRMKWNHSGSERQEIVMRATVCTDAFSQIVCMLYTKYVVVLHEEYMVVIDTLLA